jgi:hypothetical protein
LLGEGAGKHRITISSMCSDHPKRTAGGSISNHYYGRAVDIATVDGRPVGPGNIAARQLAVALSRLDPRLRPSEIGSPWQLPGASYFSDAAHQNHLHIGFDDSIDPSWTAPPGTEPESTQVEATGESDAARAGAIVRQAAIDPDDLEGNLDDEDAGADEEDGSNEDEADEGDGEDDDGGTDDEESDGEGEEDDEGDDGQDAPGEGSNGEDADDDAGSGNESPDGSDGGADPSLGPSDVETDYPGDDAPHEQLARWMGSAARRRGLPTELPVMAALTESGLRNLSYGDADSIGFFQMRTSIWDRGEYSGYAERPERQLQWFLDHAAAVKEQRLARGLPIDDPNHYGEWIADVERPAAQYRGRYQLRLEQARALLASA